MPARMLGPVSPMAPKSRSSPGGPADPATPAIASGRRATASKAGLRSTTYGARSLPSRHPLSLLRRPPVPSRYARRNPAIPGVGSAIAGSSAGQVLTHGAHEREADDRARASGREGEGHRGGTRSTDLGPALQDASRRAGV